MPVPGSASAHRLHPPPPALLSNDAVHLWRADLDSAASRPHRLDRSLSREERARAARFHFAADRERFAAARGVVRAILARYLNTTPACLRIRQGAGGKPFLPDHDHLRFNISHTPSTMLVAMAREREVGVDIERLDAGVAVAELAETTLSMPERRFLDGLDGESSRAAFITFWTRKEAILKADGRGLSLRPSDIDVCDPGGLVTLWDEPTSAWTQSTRWLLRTPALDSAHVAAVAAEGRGWQIASRRWPEDLVDAASESEGDG